MKLLGALLIFVCGASAHVGVRDVFFEGLAGPYPVTVVIRTPRVIPGVAEVQVRTGAADVDGVRITPMTLSGPGAKYPPTPDQLARVSGDSQMFSGSSWLMVTGAWQVRIFVAGKRGEGILSVPVAAVSDQVAQMERPMEILLGVLLSLLVVGMVGIAGAAFAESRLAPGETAHSGGKIWLVRGASLVVASAIIWVGWTWWKAEAADYAESIYRPLEMKLSLTGPELEAKLSHTGWYQSEKLDDFIADHGYKMHLFLIQKDGPNSIYHLHPKSDAAGSFRFSLPQLLPGSYRAFGDVVHASGFAETLTADITIPASAASGVAGTPDDVAWKAPKLKENDREFALSNGWRVRWEGPQELRANRPLQLHFKVVDQDGNPVKTMKPYLGMAGHLAVFRRDLSVFAHLHPAGTPSMGAFEIAQQGLGQLWESSPMNHESDADIPGTLSFPFGFPQSGEYCMVLQFRDSRDILNAMFLFTVM